MPKWKYTALQPDGAVFTGYTEGPNKPYVEQLLISSGVVALNIEISGLDLISHFKARTLSRKERSFMLRQIATLLTAGLDLDAALKFVWENTTSRTAKRVSAQLRDAVRDGMTLANAMLGCPNNFHQLDIGLVQAGEASGELAHNVEHLANLAEKEQALLASIRSAMIYPLLIITVAAITIFLLFTQLFPLFMPLLEDSRSTLSPATLSLMKVSSFLSNNSYVMCFTTTGLLLLGRILLQLSFIRLYLHRLFFYLPVINKLLADFIGARVCRTLGTMLQSGIPLISALRMTQGVISNLVVISALETTIEAVKGGDGLAAAFAKGGILPPRTIVLLRLGEETAQLSKLTLHAATLHENRTTLQIQQLISLIVPVTTILLGILVAWIVSSVMLTILSLDDLAK